MPNLSKRQGKRYPTPRSATTPAILIVLMRYGQDDDCSTIHHENELIYCGTSAAAVVAVVVVIVEAGEIGLKKVALASASTFSGSVARTPSGSEGLPNVCCRRTSRLLL